MSPICQSFSTPSSGPCTSNIRWTLLSTHKLPILRPVQLCWWPHSCWLSSPSLCYLTSGGSTRRLSPVNINMVAAFLHCATSLLSMTSTMVTSLNILGAIDEVTPSTGHLHKSVPQPHHMMRQQTTFTHPVVIPSWSQHWSKQFLGGAIYSNGLHTTLSLIT